jgi:hypothetical protein
MTRHLIDGVTAVHRKRLANDSFDSRHQLQKLSTVFRCGQLGTPVLHFALAHWLHSPELDPGRDGAPWWGWLNLMACQLHSCGADLVQCQQTGHQIN